MLENEVVLILDFGGQYSQLIARRVRDLKVWRDSALPHQAKKKSGRAAIKGLYFPGTELQYMSRMRRSVTGNLHPKDSGAWNLFGAQLMANMLGGTVAQKPGRSTEKQQ